MHDRRLSRGRLGRSAVVVATVAGLLGAPAPALGGPAPQPPAIAVSSPSAILTEAGSGQVIYEKNSHERRSAASLTKLMTLVIALEAVEQGRARPDDEVVASAHAASLGGTTIFLAQGERFSLADILKSVAVGSANDAAVALAEHISGSEQAFVEEMNRKAAELGLSDTRFANSHGLDAEGQYTSAHDLAVLARYAVNVPGLLQLTSIYHDEIKGHRKSAFHLDNFNKLLVFYEGTDGLKTGYTDRARACVAATAKRGETRMIAVILGSTSGAVRQTEVERLLNYGFANYQSVAIAGRGEAAGSPVAVLRGTSFFVQPVAAGAFGVAVRKGQTEGLQRKVQQEGRVEAPVRQGQVLGYLIVTRGEQELGRVALIAPQDIPRAGFANLAWGLLRRLFWPASGD